jgi:hypothetical protein
MPGSGANARFMMPIRDAECLGELARAGTKPANIFDAAALFHQGEATPGFEASNQNEATTFTAFDEQVQHPVNAVIEIDVYRPRLIALNERPSARAGKGVARLVVQGQIRLRLHDNARAFSPDQFRPDKIARADQRIALEKRAP